VTQLTQQTINIVKITLDDSNIILRSKL